jgi:hypothetical protein
MSITANDSELRLDLGEELARELLEGALGTELRCDTDLEPEFESMLRTLDRKGRGAKYTMATDGADVIASRRGSKLRIEVEGEDGWELSATLPWKAAQCLLGRQTTAADFGPIKVSLKTSDGERYKLELK